MIELADKRGVCWIKSGARSEAEPL